MKVEKLPNETGPGGWAEILPERPPARILEQSITADWLVIGAGFAGLSAASRLCQLCRGDEIVLIDAFRAGDGAAGRNSGFMIDLPHDLASDDYSGTSQPDEDEIALNRAAIEFARRLAQEANVAGSAFNECGKINAAAGARGLNQLRQYRVHLAALNEEYDVLDESRMRELTGSEYYREGLYTPGTVLIQPAAYVRSLAERLSTQSQVYENTPAASINKQGRAYTVNTPKGVISTANIILAVNGHVQSFGHFENRLMHVFTYASMTRNLTGDEARLLGGENHWGIIPADPLGTTVRRISGSLYGGERILIRNRATYNPSLESSPAQLANVALSHDQSFRSRFPMLKNVEMEYCWGGRLCLSRNNVPAFGEVEENIYSAACQNGLGTVKGTLSGMLAAELACGQTSAMLDVYTAMDKPARLVPEPFMSIGARSVLKFREWKAGKEL